MKLSNTTYDILKYIALIALPALATFYAGLSEVWSLPYATQIPATITLTDALLGTMLMISSSKYHKQQ